MRRLGLFVCLAACGGAQRARDVNDEYLKAIRIEGNDHIERKELIPGLALQRALEEGRAADPYQLQQDTERVRGAYLRRGYFSVDVKSRTDHEGKAQIVVFTVVEGKRSTTHVDIQGLPPDVPVADVRKLFPLDEGAPFDYDDYDDAKQPMLERVVNAGYARARLDDSRVVADLEHAVANVHIVFDPGLHCTFAEPKIVGATGGLLEAVQARVTFHAGDTFTAKAITTTQTDLYEMGRFSSVRIEPDRSGDATVIPVTIVLAVGNRHEVHFGFGAGFDPGTFEGRGRAGYSVIAPFEHDLTTFSIDGRLALAFPRTDQLVPDFGSYEPRGRGGMALHRTDLFRTYMNGDVEVGVQYLTLEAFTMYGPHLRLGLDTPLGRKDLQLRAAWQIEALWFRALDAVIDGPASERLGLAHYQRNGTYTQSISLDLRDKPITTRRGLYAALQVTEGTPYAGGALSYVELLPEVRLFYPLGPLVFAARGRIGAIMGDVPVSERFYAGGPNSHRGFPARTLSPVVSGTIDGATHSVVVGGAGLVETSAEVRVPLPSIPFETLVFLDGGDVTDKVDQLRLTHLHWAIGSGLRFLLGGVPAGVDFGYRLNRKTAEDPNPGSSWSVFLVIGEAY
jgi:outer membrane protein assembly factor BamA